MLSPAERSQHILAARAVQVSPVRAHVPAPTQTHSHPSPPTQTLCSPQSCQSLPQGQLLILSSISLSASIIPVFQGPDSNPSPRKDSPTASTDNQSLRKIHVSLSFGKQIIFCLASVGWCRCL